MIIEMAKMGRPLKEIDWEEFDKLCALQCPLSEIAGWFTCSEDTIENKCKSEKGMTFSEYYAQKKGTGKVALRRAQFNMSLKNPTMAIWLGKNWIDQSDKNEVKSTHEVGPESTAMLSDVLKELIELKKTR
jgi:hypothetical protein